MFTADSLPTRDGVMSLLRTFAVTGQIPEATTMNPDGLIDTASSAAPMEKYR